MTNLADKDQRKDRRRINVYISEESYGLLLDMAGAERFMGTWIDAKIRDEAELRREVEKELEAESRAVDSPEQIDIEPFHDDGRQPSVEEVSKLVKSLRVANYAIGKYLDLFTRD